MPTPISASAFLSRHLRRTTFDAAVIRAATSDVPILTMLARLGAKKHHISEVIYVRLLAESHELWGNRRNALRADEVCTQESVRI